MPTKKGIKQIKCGGLFPVKPLLQLPQKDKDLDILVELIIFLAIKPFQTILKTHALFMVTPTVTMNTLRWTKFLTTTQS